MPVLRDPAVKVREVATTLYKSTGKKGAFGYSCRSERYRYIEWINRYTGKLVGQDLFDYEKDPHESQNLVTNPEYAQVLKEMKDKLHKDTAGWKVLEKSRK